jgi:glycosyltransferase involved in cell wall biosynthesis
MLYCSCLRHSMVRASTHPTVTEPFPAQSSDTAGERPRISLVIPAFNEAAYLPRLLDSVDAARNQYRHGPDRAEVIVADNASTDETPAIAARRGCRVARVEKRRIAAARNGGAAIARADILAFADADFRIHPVTFNYIDDVMAKPGFIGGATGLTMERWSPGIAASWYLIMPPLWLLGMDGGVWFCRRTDFLEVGGFDESRPIGEDVHFLSRLKRLGAKRRPKQRLATRFTARKIGHQPALVLNSSRKFDKHGDWHMIPDTLLAAWYLLFAKHKFQEYTKRYWYDERSK